MENTKDTPENQSKNNVPPKKENDNDTMIQPGIYLVNATENEVKFSLLAERCYGPEYPGK